MGVEVQTFPESSGPVRQKVLRPLHAIEQTLLFIPDHITAGHASKIGEGQKANQAVKSALQIPKPALKENEPPASTKTPKAEKGSQTGRTTVKITRVLPDGKSQIVKEKVGDVAQRLNLSHEVVIEAYEEAKRSDKAKRAEVFTRVVTDFQQISAYYDPKMHDMAQHTGLNPVTLMKIIKTAHTTKIGGTYEHPVGDRVHTYHYGVDLQGRAKIAMDKTNLLGQGSYARVHEVPMVGSDEVLAIKEAVPKKPEEAKKSITEIKNEVEKLKALYDAQEDIVGIVRPPRIVFHQVGQIEEEGQMQQVDQLGHISEKYSTDLLKKFAQGVDRPALMKGSQEILSGLAYLHAREIGHMDLKPENFILDDKTGQCKIADFGGAKNLKNAAQEILERGKTYSNFYLDASDIREMDNLVNALKFKYITEEEFNTKMGPLIKQMDVYATAVSFLEMAVPEISNSMSAPSFKSAAAYASKMAYERLKTEGYSEEFAQLVHDMMNPNRSMRPAALECAQRMSEISGIPLPATIAEHA